MCSEQLKKLFHTDSNKVNEDGEQEMNDGKFWMSWDDFMTEFESLTVCHLDNPSEHEQRAVGTFVYGQGGNSPANKDEMSNDYLNPEKHFQIKLTVTSPGLIKFQLLLGKLSLSQVYTDPAFKTLQ